MRFELLHAVPAGRRAFGMTCQYQATTLIRWEVVHWLLTTILNSPSFSPSRVSACLGEAQIEQTPVNQAFKSRNTDELFFLHFHFMIVLYPGNPMWWSVEPERVELEALPRCAYQQSGEVRGVRYFTISHLSTLNYLYSDDTKRKYNVT